MPTCWHYVAAAAQAPRRIAHVIHHSGVGRIVHHAARHAAVVAPKGAWVAVACVAASPMIASRLARAPLPAMSAPAVSERLVYSPPSAAARDGFGGAGYPEPVGAGAPFPLAEGGVPPGFVVPPFERAPVPPASLSPVSPYAPIDRLRPLALAPGPDLAPPASLPAPVSPPAITEVPEPGSLALLGASLLLLGGLRRLASSRHEKGHA